MLLRIFLVALSVIAQSPDWLPEHLRCQISGEGGCSPSGICVGSGRRYDKISMAIDTTKKTIVINDIGGRIEGAGPLNFGDRRSVFWHPRLFGLSTIHVRPEASRDGRGMPYTTVELENGTDQVEFACRAAR